MHPQNGDPVILCVDDEREILGSLRRCFRNEACQVLTAASRDEAFGWLGAMPRIDLVLSDERMPGGTGTELLREIRTRYPGAARALLTSFPSDTLVREGLEAGVEAFLYKPWDDEVLRQTVRRLLRRPRATPPAARPEGEEPPGSSFDLGGEG